LLTSTRVGRRRLKPASRAKARSGYRGLFRLNRVAGLPPSIEAAVERMDVLKAVV
jgi:hypothetical protein